MLKLKNGVGIKFGIKNNCFVAIVGGLFHRSSVGNNNESVDVSLKWQCMTFCAKMFNAEVNRNPAIIPL